MVNGKPCFIIATNYFGLDRQIKKDMEEQYPNQCHTVSEHDYHDEFRHLLTVMQYDALEQKWNE